MPEEDYTIEIGKAKVVSEGTDVTILTYGASVFQCLEAMDKLPEDISVELIDLRTVSPVDKDAIIQSVTKTGRCVIVHEAPKTCGFGAELATIIQEHCFLSMKAPVQRVAGFDTIMPYYKLELEYLPNADRVVEAVTQVMAY